MQLNMNAFYMEDVFLVAINAIKGSADSKQISIGECAGSSPINSALVEADALNGSNFNDITWKIDPFHDFPHLTSPHFSQNNPHFATPFPLNSILLPMQLFLTSMHRQR